MMGNRFSKELKMLEGKIEKLNRLLYDKEREDVSPCVRANELVELVNSRVVTLWKAGQRGIVKPPKGWFNKRCPQCGLVLASFKTAWDDMVYWSKNEYRFQFSGTVFYCVNCGYEYVWEESNDDKLLIAGLPYQREAAYKLLSWEGEIRRYYNWFSENGKVG